LAKNFAGFTLFYAAKTGYKRKFVEIKRKKNAKKHFLHHFAPLLLAV